jgi:hypothetical protein
MDKTRIPDLKRLEGALKTETRPGVRKIIEEAHYKVNEQLKDNWLTGARAELTKESQRSAGNMMQIHEDIKKHESKNMGIGKSSFSINISQERWDKIMGK